MNDRLKNSFKETDFLLLFGCLAASVYGFLMVHSATRNDALESGLPLSRELIVMIVSAAIGILFCIIISFFDYNSIERMWFFVAAVCLLLILALFVWGEAPEDRPNAKCWLPTPFGVYFQPSELAKVGFLITFSNHVERVRRDMNKPLNVLLLTLHALVPIGLIILTDDLGSAIVFGFMFTGMMFMAGLKIRYFVAAFGAIAAAVPVLWTKFLSNFHRQRILAIYYPEALSETVYKARIYQQQRAVNAIGAGGLFGDGLFKGTYTQSEAGIPVNESDMVFSVVGEELGLVGGILLLAILAFICLRIIKTAKSAYNVSGSLICYGTVFMISSQAVMNIGMCLKLLPCIGITLPFISAGGSANLCIYLAIGLVLSVYRFNKNKSLDSMSIYDIRTQFER
ncbi:MAG: FtsW/RodA/SpoVE family cell cycle protein [Clostridia bacterium]|nr:FtsW/RodA/SpoVE family cell cycle protein [Clostridia bacterium]